MVKVTPDHVRRRNVRDRKQQGNRVSQRVKDPGHSNEVMDVDKRGRVQL